MMVPNKFRLCVPDRHSYALTLISAAEKSLKPEKISCFVTWPAWKNQILLQKLDNCAPIRSYFWLWFTSYHSLIYNL
jgi:hypothetical protein